MMKFNASDPSEFAFFLFFIWNAFNGLDRIQGTEMKKIYILFSSSLNRMLTKKYLTII